MIRAVPIPPAVWQRFAALDSVCDARIERRDTYEQGKLTSGRNFTRIWRVEIWGRNDLSSRITADGADLARTLEVAVRCAEAKFGYSR